MRQRSSRAEIKAAERAAAMQRHFGQKPACWGRGIIPACKPWDHDAITVHEPARRSQGADPTDPAQGMPLCFDGHRWVHDHPLEASKLHARDGRVFYLLASS